MDDDRETQIRERAYQIWQAEGEPLGREKAHWDQASGEIGGSAEADGEIATSAPAEAGTSAAAAAEPSTSAQAGPNASADGAAEAPRAAGRTKQGRQSKR